MQRVTQTQKVYKRKIYYIRIALKTYTIKILQQNLFHSIKVSSGGLHLLPIRGSLSSRLELTVSLGLVHHMHQCRVHSGANEIPSEQCDVDEIEKLTRREHSQRRHEVGPVHSKGMHLPRQLAWRGGYLAYSQILQWELVEVHRGP